MKKIILLSIIAIALITSSFTISGADGDLTECVVKVKSDWGLKQDCMEYKDSYVVYLKNTCEQSLDIMCAMQNTDKTWRITNHNDVKAGDTITVWSCYGTGKYLKWVKKHGDKEVIFPTKREINAEYK